MIGTEHNFTEVGKALGHAVLALGERDEAIAKARAEDAAKAKHALKHPTSGKFVTEDQARRLMWRHQGAPHPGLLADTEKQKPRGDRILSLLDR